MCPVVSSSSPHNQQSGPSALPVVYCMCSSWLQPAHLDFGVLPADLKRSCSHSFGEFLLRSRPWLVCRLYRCFLAIFLPSQWEVFFELCVGYSNRWFMADASLPRSQPCQVDFYLISPDSPWVQSNSTDLPSARLFRVFWHLRVSFDFGIIVCKAVWAAWFRCICSDSYGYFL